MHVIDAAAGIHTAADGEADIRVATNRVHHGADAQNIIELTVLPQATADRY